MWGNKNGWMISGMIALAMLGLMYWLTRQADPAGMTEAFAKDPKNLEALALDPAPETILTTMTDNCDAAEKYREAVASLEKSPQLYDDRNFDFKTIDQMDALDKVVEGQNCRDLTLVTKNAADVINFEYTDKPLIDNLKKLGLAAANKANVLKASKDLPTARKYAEAAFALGAKLYKERVIYDELSAGLGVMTSASRVLTGIAHDEGNEDQSKRMKAFELACIKFSDGQSRVHQLNAITRTIDPQLSGERAGDVFALAEKSKERMWRVEACLQLARTQRNVASGYGPNQQYAKKVLSRLATDAKEDPIVKIAATRARDITDAEYNRQH